MGFQKTKIEWADYTWNTVSGCKNGCWYCYARRIRERFNPSIPFTEIIPSFSGIFGPVKLKKPARIFVGSMTDYFAEWAKGLYYDVKHIIEITAKYPQHTFMFLTKTPQNYSRFTFPKNCWLGTTYTGGGDVLKIVNLKTSKNDNIKYVSYEPMLDNSYVPIAGIDWLILGALTGPGANKYKPKDEDVKKIIERCQIYNVPLFMKHSLGWHNPIQQYPKAKVL